MKTKEQILDQYYMSANDLKVIVPTMGINACREFIDLIRTEMKNKYFVPSGRTKVALTELVKKKLGIK